MQSKHSKKETICKFYQEGHCRYGDKCNYLHKGEVKVNTLPSTSFGRSSNKNEEKKITSYQEDKLSIANENKLQTPTHFIEFNKTIEGKKNFEENKEIWGEKGFLVMIRNLSGNAGGQDLAQVIRRFQHEIFFGSLEGGFPQTSIVFIRFSPACKYEFKESLYLKEDQIIIKIDLKTEVDFGKFEESMLKLVDCKRKIEIINGSLDEELRKKLNKVISIQLDHFGNRMFVFFKWIDSNFNELFEKANNLQFEKKLQIEGIEENKNDSNSESSNDENCKKESFFNEISSDDGKETEEKKIEAANDTDPRIFSIKNFQANLIYNIIIKGLSIFNIGVILIDEATLHLSCGNCRKDNNVTLFNNKFHRNYLLNLLPCQNCITSSRAVIYKEPAHLAKDIIGKLGIASWKFQDFLFASFQLTCENCGNDMPLKDAQRGKQNNLKCFTCFKGMNFTFEGINIEKIHDLDLPEQNSKTASKNIEKTVYHKKKIGIFKPGQPLPKKGACKHYKYSFRWFRFPCCGKAFPCDNCHMDNEKHEYEKANSMVCGHCSSEQSVKSICSKCGEGLTRDGPKSGHWEGGKGCRNTVQMSKKDGKKFKGTGKTYSKKSQENK